MSPWRWLGRLAYRALTSLLLAATLFLAIVQPAAAIIAIVQPRQIKEAEERFAAQAEHIRTLQSKVAQTATALDSQVQRLESQASKLDTAASRCRERIARHELDVCTVTLKQLQLSISAAQSLADELRQTAATCRVLSYQTATDLRALNTQLNVIERGRTELADWAKANNEAQTAALKDG